MWVEQNGEGIESDDQLWALFDQDHHFQANHVRGTTRAIQEAKSREVKIAVSNPCFEVWLILHFCELPRETPIDGYPEAERILCQYLNCYGKSNIRADKWLTAERCREAVKRAKDTDVASKACPPGTPKNPGTHVYLLLEEMLHESS